jgi:hypothetical protein
MSLTFVHFSIRYQIIVSSVEEAVSDYSCRITVELGDNHCTLPNIIV